MLLQLFPLKMAMAFHEVGSGRWVSGQIWKRAPGVPSQLHTGVREEGGEVLAALGAKEEWDAKAQIYAGEAPRGIPTGWRSGGVCAS